MDEQLETMKVKAALRSENMKMEYRKTNKPKEINILDYTVIEALKKQIPQKVIKIKGISSQACPICLSNVNYNFCPGCGQRIKY